MCGTNDRDTVCGKSINSIILNTGADARIPWCRFTERRVIQILAGFRCTPSNYTHVSAADGIGTIHTVFDFICREVCCHFPENKQFAEAVRPRLKRFIEGRFKWLDERNHIVIYKEVSNTTKKVYWPPHSRAWAKPNWNFQFGEPVSPEQRHELKMIKEGGPIPAFLTAYENELATNLRSSPTSPSPRRRRLLPRTRSPAPPPTRPAAMPSPPTPPTPHAAIYPWLQQMRPDDAVSATTTDDGIPPTWSTSASSEARAFEVVREARRLAAAVTAGQGPASAVETTRASGSVAAASEPFCGTSRSAKRRAARRRFGEEAL